MPPVSRLKRREMLERSMRWAAPGGLNVREGPSGDVAEDKQEYCGVEPALLVFARYHDSSRGVNRGFKLAKCQRHAGIRLRDPIERRALGLEMLAPYRGR
jgi:hypothetical protein